MADRETVLVVDDDREITAILTEFLEGEGHPVVVAHTGVAAIQIIQETPVALILLDLQLPDIDGIQVLREARRLDAAPEVIIVTGHASLDSAIEAVDLRTMGYLRKPVDLPRLGAIVRRVIERTQLMRDNTHLTRELTDRLKDTEALLAISKTISSTLDVEEALRRVCRNLTLLVGADTGTVYLHDAPSDQLLPFAGYHVPKELLSTLLTVPLPLREQGFHTQLWRERRPVFSDDIPGDPRFTHEMFRRFRHQSGLLLPLILDDEVAGTFYFVWWTARRHLKDHELALLESVATQVAVLLRNARLFEQADRERRRLDVLYDVSRRLAAVHETDQVLSLLVNEATRLLSVEAAGIRLLEGDDLVVSARTESAAALMAKPRIKVGASLTGRVVATNEPVVVEDLVEDTRFDAAHKRGALEQGFHGYLGVPLRLEGRVIGALNVYTKSRRRFRPDEVSLLAALGDQASLAIDKAKLLREAQEGRQLVERLYRVALSMQRSWDRDDRLQAFASGAREAIGFDRISVLLVTPDGAGLDLVTTQGQDSDGPPATLPLSSAAGPFFQAIETRRPITVLSDGDLGHVLPLDPAYGRHPYFRSKSFLIAPLVAGERVLGVATADNKQSRRPIPPASVEPFSLFCQQLATALEEARLYAETRTQQTRLAQILDSTSDGILLVSREGRIESANRRAGELLGLDPDDVLGIELVELLAGYRSSIPDYDRAFHALQSLTREPDRETEGDLDLRGQKRVLHWVARPTKDAAGTTIGFTLTFHDVTQEREVSQMKSDFVSFVTHQLRTPLAGIRWMLELAGQEAHVPADAASYVQDARDSAQRLIRLVNDLLNISRLERGKISFMPQEVRLPDLTKSVLEETSLLVQEKGHRVTVEGGEDVPAVVADSQLLRQVVLNLVSNAVKYTPAGGDIAIRMERNAGAAHWSIRDSGIGIPAGAQERLFEKFYRAENVATVETEGTGLGLYLVRLIMEQFGGRVWCESEEGRGATFRFMLPVQE